MVTHHCLVLGVSGLNYKITGYHGFKNWKWFLRSQDVHMILDLEFFVSILESSSKSSIL